MALEQTLEQKVLDWLAQSCPSFHCAACANQQFEIGDLTMEMYIPGYSTGMPLSINLAKPHSTVPVRRTIPVICKKCGHTAYFCARAVGVVP